MPTRNRAAFAHRALDCVMRQTGVELEVVILDDLDSPSFFNAPEFEGVHYHISETRMSIGEKRNRLCDMARGGVIAHFDDDDYSAPGRLADQLERLMSSGAMLTGYSEMVFEDQDGACWLHSGKSDYVIGTSMMYRKAFWKANPFPAGAGRPVDFIGEDTVFLAAARRIHSVAAAPAGEMMLARIHGGNTGSRKPIPSPQWRKIERKAA